MVENLYCEDNGFQKIVDQATADVCRSKKFGSNTSKEVNLRTAEKSMDEKFSASFMSSKVVQNILNTHVSVYSKNPYGWNGTCTVVTICNYNLACFLLVLQGSL